MVIDTKELRELAEAAFDSEHRPPPCTICELAKMAKDAADELDLRRGNEPPKRHEY